MKQYLNHSDIIEIVLALKKHRKHQQEMAGILTNEDSRAYVLGIAEEARELVAFFEAVADRLLDDPSNTTIPCRGL